MSTATPQLPADPAGGDEASQPASARRLEDALPTWKRQLPIVVVIAAFVIGLLLMVVIGNPGGYRAGLCVMGAALLGAALLRAVLTVRRAGLLVVRHRVFDTLVFGASGVAMVVLSLSLPPS